MKMTKDSDGHPTSIYIDGVKDFQWTPHKNVIIHTSFPTGDNVYPRITFLDMPSRRVLQIYSAKDSVELKLYQHPQGRYLAAMNKFQNKKQLKYNVELFETSNLQGSIPHQQIAIKREVAEFHNIVFEPNQGKIAVHTLFKKELKAGEKQFSNEPNRLGVDMYQIKTDALLGFNVKPMGLLPSEKIKQFYFSCVGNIFSTVEQDGPTRHSLNFYMISKISNEGKTTSAEQQSNKKGARLVTEKHLAAVDDTYEFKKIARHDVSDKNWNAHWDEQGRYFVISGRKSSQFDKTAKSIKFYNMFGEPLMFWADLYGLDQVRFRPRPADTLTDRQLKKLKKDYKTKYEPMVREEENKDKKEQTDIVKDQRKIIRDNFFDNFFIPQRRSFEANIAKYQALFPIKESDISSDPATI